MPIVSSPPPAPFLKTTVNPFSTVTTVLLALWLTWLPWFYGGREALGQVVSLGLAALALGAAFGAKRWTASELGHCSADNWGFRTLLRLPFLWIALLLLGWVVVQGLNPAWRFERNETLWWLSPSDHVSWLPSGVAAPFDRTNSWRMIIIWLAPLCAGLALHFGTERRRDVKVLVYVVVANAVAIALLGCVQKVGNWHLLALEKFKSEPFGTFIYRNHSAAYFLIGICLCAGLALHHFRRWSTPGTGSSPAHFFVICAGILGTAILYSGSRLGVVFSGLCLVAIAGIGVFRYRPRFGIADLVLIGSGLATIGVMAITLVHNPQHSFRKRLNEAVRFEDSNSFQGRLLGGDLTLNVIRDYTWKGVGAGALRHIEPAYNRRYPLLTQEVGLWYADNPRIIRTVLMVSHNDHLQMVAELGFVGASLIYLLGAGALASLTVRQQHPLALAMLVCLVGLLLFAMLDFPFINPAVIGTLVFCCVAVNRWADFDRTRVVMPTKPLPDVETKLRPNSTGVDRASSGS